MKEYRAEYSAVDLAAPEFGECAVLPWDSEIFGFKVASYVPADLAIVSSQSRALAQALRKWMHSHEVELLSCHIPASSFSWINFLGESGFLFVDVSLLAFARRLTNLPVARIEVRLAVDEDLPRLMEIAGDSFKFGRYHADARFPKAKADERYRWWIRNAMSARDDQDLVYVCGAKGQPTGFIHIVQEGTTADLRLAAVDAAQNAGILGQGLFVGALQHMVSRGARSAKARLSAGNTTVLNLYSSLDFAFQEADVIYHLHAPDSRHLSLAL